MSRLEIKGIIPPHITPFTRNGEIDENGLREDVDWWIESGLHGLVPCGSNGEAVFLTEDERRRIFTIVIDEANGRVPVIAGTGMPSTRQTIAMTKLAEDLGADAAMVVTPHYFSPMYGQEALYEHYKMVAEAVDLPILLYNVPKFTNVNLEPETVARLSELDNVVGIKDSSGSIGQISSTIQLTKEGFSVMAGTGNIVYPVLTLGGKGGVIGVSNVAPRLCVDLYNRFMMNDLEGAREIQLRILRLNSAVTATHGIPGLKAALEILGRPAGPPRRPLLPASEAVREEIKKIMTELGLLAQ
ncbi:MAG: 4-hydroxy-tetrahydrodipicolinate synthase [Candidatus Geothermarchaeales archaeon]